MFFFCLFFFKLCYANSDAKTIQIRSQIMLMLHTLYMPSKVCCAYGPDASFGEPFLTMSFQVIFQVKGRHKMAQDVQMKNHLQ